MVGYGQARGWSPSTLRRVQHSLAALLASQPTLARPLEAAAVRQFLLERHLTVLRVVEFLANQGLVRVDEHAALDRWLAGRLQPLAAPIQAEVQIWIQGLRGRGPRAGRPRRDATIQGYVRAAAPALADWSARYQSLRQVTTKDVTAQLEPLAGPTRKLTLVVLRSLFRTLKARRLIFTNPAAGLTAPGAPPLLGLGLEPARRAGLLGRLDRPDQQLIVLLAGVHALRPHQIRVLALEDIDPGTGILRVAGRPRRLDSLTGQALRGWLELRRVRWPASANPYLLVNQSTAGGLTPVTRGYVQAVFQQLGVTAEDLRVDRLLAEVEATGADPLKLTEFFSITDTTAIRYCFGFGSPDQRPATIRSPLAVALASVVAVDAAAEPATEHERQPTTGQLRRLARVALDQQGVVVGRLRWMGEHSNHLFRCDTTTGGRLLIRLCLPEGRSDAELDSELAWLEALARDTDLTVPAVRFSTRAATPDLPAGGRCIAFAWVEGCHCEQHPSRRLVADLGRVLATLHAHARQFRPPAGFTRPTLDIGRLTWAGTWEATLLAQRHIDPATRQLLGEVAARVEAALAQLGSSPEAHGLVHADLHLGNVLDHHGQARPLDFDDAAWGHYAMDLAITVDSIPEPLQPVLLGGYQAVQPLPDGYQEHAAALLAGRRLFLATFLLAAGLPAAAHLDLLRAFAAS